MYPQALTQIGIAAATGASQDHVSYAVKELKSKGYIEELLARVSGEKRRRKVYKLTSKGGERAERIRTELENTAITVKYSDGKVANLELIEVSKQYKLEPLEVVNLLSSSREVNAETLIETARKKYTAVESQFIEFIDDAPKLRYFVGRKHELELIRNWLDSSTHRVIVIYGIAGIGKTTLASKLLDEYKGKQHLFWYRFHNWDTIRNMLSYLSEFLAQLDRKGLKSYLASNPSAPTVELHEVSKLLESDLQNSNVILVFDDFQRVRESIAQLFAMILEILSKVDGVKVIVVGRRILPFYDRSAVIVKEVVKELQLLGLDEASSKELLKLEGVDESKFDLIYKLTKGHPLFLELIAAGGDIAAQRDVRRYIHEEIFSKLGEDEKTLLRVASIFRYPVHHKAFFVVGGDDISYDTIDKLVDRCLLQETSYETYDVHDMVKDFFYIRLTPQYKSKYHNDAARYYLEEGGDLAAIEAQYHFIKAGAYDKAAKLALGSGHELISKGYLEEFLAVLEQFDQSATPRGYWADLMLLKADVLTIIGEWDKALHCYTETVTIGKADDKKHVVAEAYRKMGYIQMKRGEREIAVENEEKALKISEQIQDYRGIADTYRKLGEFYGGIGEFERAIEYHERSIEYANKVEDVPGLAKAYVELGTVYSNKGEHVRAIEYYEKSMGILENLGDMYELAKVSANLGVVYADKSELDKALKYFEQSIGITETSGDIRQMGYALANAGEAYARKGELERALEYLDDALEIFNKLGEQFMIAEVYSNYGTIYRLREDWDKSAKYYQDALKILENLNIPYYIAKVAFELGKLYVNQGNVELASTYLHRALQIWDSLKSRSNVDKVRAELHALQTYE
jgi:tetratricopeptide (TPR) repeat protein/DNA-binding PadR family transcriptional regulator